MRYTPQSDPYMKVGDRALFFDDMAWTRTKDTNIPDVFWRAATVVEAYWESNKKIVNIKFDHRETVSLHHFCGPQHTRPITSYRKVA